jgi:hypothetical protein
MNKLMHAGALGPQLVSLLGMPKTTRSFELRCAVNELVTVKCEYYLEESHGAELLLAEYELVPRKSAPMPADGSGTAGQHFDEWMRERTNAAHTAYMERIACLPN